MFKLFLKILKDEFGGTLSITRKTSGTVATAAAQNSNADEIEAVVNGAIEAANIANDAVTAVKLNSDVLRANYGLAQHTDGTLYIDLHATPGLEFSGGKLRVDGYGLISLSSDGVIWGRTGDMLFSSSVTTPDGFTDVSATYTNRFIRINATALTEANMPVITHAHGMNSHTHTTPDHLHSMWVNTNAGGRDTLETCDGDHLSNTNFSVSSGSGTSGAASGNTENGGESCVYITLKAYSKN